jgi:hypothetical protein
VFGALVAEAAEAAEAMVALAALAGAVVLAEKVVTEVTEVPPFALIVYKVRKVVVVPQEEQLRVAKLATLGSQVPEAEAVLLAAKVAVTCTVILALLVPTFLPETKI